MLGVCGIWDMVGLVSCLFYVFLSSPHVGADKVSSHVVCEKKGAGLFKGRMRLPAPCLGYCVQRIGCGG